MHFGEWLKPAPVMPDFNSDWPSSF